MGFYGIAQRSMLGGGLKDDGDFGYTHVAVATICMNIGNGTKKGSSLA